MASQVGDIVLENFKISEEDLRDLDSVVRRHCQSVKYYVHKGSSLGDYDTVDVEDVVNDRNGTETRIESILLRATGDDELKFNIEFDDIAEINGECTDRARLVLLATDVRSVIRDRMKGGTPKRKTILQVVAAVFFVLGYLGFLQIQNSYANRFTASYQAQVSQNADATDQRQANAAILSVQSRLSQATTALSKHDLNAEVDFLIEQQIGQLRQELASDKSMAALTSSSDTSSDPGTPPSWSTSGWLALAVACAMAAITVGFGYLVLPSSKSVFLIGDEKRRQDRANNRRTQLIWTIGGGFIVSIVSGLLLTLR
jgi:hypothetical protein